MPSPSSSPPKRPADLNGTAASDRDTRAEKLAKGRSGIAVTAFDQAIAGIQDKALAEATQCIDELAKMLENNAGGSGEIIFNSGGLGRAIQRLVVAVQSHPDEYCLGAVPNDTQLLPAVDASQLYQDDVRRHLTTGSSASVKCALRLQRIWRNLQVYTLLLISPSRR
mmetsp:Transcript_26571/g.57651  ORF Transcript_26571/g.57651 Transcript_26571/m.57651 type:complete len:167 (-) Transcript_26571:206-706(-)